MMGARVLVTRPEPGAARTAERLSAAGCEPVVLPLTKVAPLRQSRPTEEFDAVAASSANALRHAYPGLIRLLLEKPFFAVGVETAAAAREAGFVDIRCGQGSAEDMARDIMLGVRAPASVAYLCGRIRRNVLEAELDREGVRVVPIETYLAHSRKPSRRELAALDRAPIDAALAYSSNAAKALAGLVEPRLGTVFRDTAFIAISERVAERLRAVAPGRVSSASSPDEDAMFTLLFRAGHEPASFSGNHA
ncbi:uroporphyrinogen-III synthase [Mesorhizobium sp. BAC0120]|uniref:uroporphyrinogen-III synthase n=1 Tax=Mesorhizobium sp. BAC0120 TaxID=3090670 RepID=UPI00298C7FA7|nr:uroporphyrinogen-III synthase [Mesorhizobium sp. BAC0120]MDW6022119.1 uroporphyrinogen-III synthase [Mesorhizobium sp. BAC0120]